MAIPVCDITCGAPPIGGGGGGGAAGVLSATQISSEEPLLVNIATGRINLPLPLLDFDVGPAITPDTVGGQLIIEQDGFYYVTVSESWDPVPDITSEYHMFLMVSGATVQESAIGENLGFKEGTFSRLLQLSAGDEIFLQVEVPSGAGLVTATLAAHKL
jgi:hypothetical protein